jgi:uncharacterized protein (TIGR03435 family)
MKTTNSAVKTGVAILAAIAVTMGAKSQSSPVDDSYFNPDTDSLRNAPADLVVLRPTHFSDSYAKVSHYHENDSLVRTVGRDVPLRQAIAEAYDCTPAQVILPADAPTDRFDFLVTTSSKVRAHLRKAIEEQLHYTARRETQNTDVLVLKVSDSALPGMTVSAADESEDMNYKDGKLYFTHQPISAIVGGLSEGLNRPVLDQTGLTSAYDFSVSWGHDIETRMENGQFSVDGTRKVLAGWGLSLESSNVTMDMYVVTKAP